MDTCKTVGAGYNLLDNTIYVDTAFFHKLQKINIIPEVWAVTVAFTILHELAHSVQMQLSGIKGVHSFFGSRVNMELQADCIAGMLINAIDKKHRNLDDGDTEKMKEDSVLVGDDSIQKVIDIGFLKWLFPANHGTGKMRRTAVELGLSLSNLSGVVASGDDIKKIARGD